MHEDGDAIAIGALTRHHDLAASELLQERCNVLSSTAAEIGDPQVRHRGTIGGSVAHGDPPPTWPTVLLALEADFVVTGPGGSRTVSAAEFFQGVFLTLGRRDVLTDPRPGATGTYVKFHRRAQDWATVGVAVARVNGDVRVGLTSMGATPLRATAVEEALASGADPATAAEHAAEERARRRTRTAAPTTGARSSASSSGALSRPSSRPARRRHGATHRAP